MCIRDRCMRSCSSFRSSILRGISSVRQAKNRVPSCTLLTNLQQLAAIKEEFIGSLSELCVSSLSLASCGRSVSMPYVFFPIQSFNLLIAFLRRISKCEARVYRSTSTSIHLAPSSLSLSCFYSLVLTAMLHSLSIC